jgi:polysaccharide export outer membrane protein
MKSFRVIVLLALASAICCGAQVAGNAPTIFTHTVPVVNEALLQSLLTAPRPRLVFTHDDTISVHIYGLKDYVEEQTVAEDGTITFPLIGKLRVSGLTVQEANDLISSKLITSGVITDPQISVNALKRPSQVVTVSGDVTKPGIFPAAGDLTILDYLSQAGAFSETSANVLSVPASKTVTLLRPSLKEPVSIPLGPDPKNSPYGRIPAFAGDQILVGKVGLVYAVGAFKSQGGYPLKADGPTTLTELVALAGGVGYEADLKDAHVIRTVDASRALLPVNVSRVLDGKEPDVILTSDDILFVPTNKLRAAIKGGGSGLIVSLATAALYAH